MNERIKQIRELLEMSQEAFAASINLKRNSLSLIELGKRNPSDRTITDICEKHNVSEEWLRTGSGQIFNSTPEGPLDALARKYDLSDADVILVERFMKLNKFQRDAVTDYVKQVAQAFSEKEKEEMTTEAAEAAYREALGIAPPTGSTASSTTEGTRQEKRNAGEAG